MKTKNASNDARVTMRRRVLNFYKRKRRVGATADEVAARFQVVHNMIAPRISEMRREGLLVFSGKYRLTRLGRNAEVLVLASFAGSTATAAAGK